MFECFCCNRVGHFLKDCWYNPNTNSNDVHHPRKFGLEELLITVDPGFTIMCKLICRNIPGPLDPNYGTWIVDAPDI